MNILLNGYFDKNFGDDAMQEIIVKHFKEYDFYPNCKQREMLRHLEKYENVHIGEPVPKIDVFLNVIGTGFLYRTRYAKVTKLFEVLFKKKEKYPRMALVDCSMERFTSRLEKWLVKKAVGQYDFITCRDDISFRFLKENTKKASVFLFNDIIFAGAYVEESKRKFLGIAPVNRAKSDKNYAYYKELADFADRYIEDEKREVKLFAFDSGNENDVLAATCIKDLMCNKDNVRIVVYNSDTKELVSEFSECEMIIGSRFHSIVLAVANGIKTIAVYDNEKIARICRDFKIMGIKKNLLSAERLMHSVKNYQHYCADTSDAEGHINKLSEFFDGVEYE